MIEKERFISISGCSKFQSEIFLKTGTSILLPLFRKNRLLGILFIGNKLSGKKFNAEDINFISLIAGGALIIFENMILNSANNELEKKYLHRDKLSSMSVLASTLGDEINGSLSIIQSYCGILNSKQWDAAFVNEFEEKVPSEIVWIENVLSRVLDFGKISDSGEYFVNIEKIISRFQKIMSVCPKFMAAPMN